jgi:hypothetical protein
MTVEFWGHEFKVNIIIGCLGGFLIAIVSSMFGFGGGPFMTPLLAVGLGLPMYLVVGSSLLNDVPCSNPGRFHRSPDRQARQSSGRKEGCSSGTRNSGFKSARPVLVVREGGSPSPDGEGLFTVAHGLSVSYILMLPERNSYPIL